MNKKAMKEKPVRTNSEEHLDYLVSSVKLMLWFARKWALAHPDEDFDFILRKRVDIYRRTGFHADYLDATRDLGDNSPEWQAAIEKLKCFFEETRNDPSSERFEEMGIGLFMAGFYARLDRDLADIENSVDLARYQCGSLRHDLVTVANAPQRIGFHIANACYPYSIFHDPSYLPACLLALISQCEAHFGITEVTTSTWLNSHQKWLALFPSSWMENMGPPSSAVRWNYGYWGQFLTARKTFNHKLGKIFRETGNIPYSTRSSWCKTADLKEHLLSLVCAIGKGVLPGNGIGSAKNK